MIREGHGPVGLWDDASRGHDADKAAAAARVDPEMVRRQIETKQRALVAELLDAVKKLGLPPTSNEWMRYTTKGLGGNGTKKKGFFPRKYVTGWKFPPMSDWVLTPEGELRHTTTIHGWSAGGLVELPVIAEDYDSSGNDGGSGFEWTLRNALQHFMAEAEKR